jgi:hypothetical protein
MGSWILPLLAVMSTVALDNGGAPPADGSAPPADCVEASQLEDASRDDTLILKLDNGCSVPVSCTISWTVRCKNGEAHPSSRAANIAAGASQSLEASASVCSEAGWRITPPKWSCSSK